MNDTIIIELELLGEAFITGVLLMAVYGIFLIIRELHKHKKWLTVVEDLIFWMFAAAVLFYMLYRENSGIVRGFFIASAALGMLFWYQIHRIFFIKPLKKMMKRITMKRRERQNKRKIRREALEKHGKPKKQRKHSGKKPQKNQKPQEKPR